MEKIKTYLLRLFADRQIYIRSQGNVTFITLSRRAIVACAGGGLALVLWVGFASINVLFEDDIVAQREREARAKHQAYEVEINRLHVAYDDVARQLSLATDWFKETTNNIEKRHNELNKVLEQHEQVSSNLRDMQQTFASAAQRNKRIRNKTELVAQAGNAEDMMMESRTASVASSPPTLHLSGTPHIMAIDGQKMVVPHVSDEVLTRLDRLGTRQGDLLDALEESIDMKVGQFEALIAETNIVDKENFMARVLGSEARASGGPYIPLPDESNLNSQLHRQLYRISNTLDRLESLSKFVTQVPFALPIHDYRLTSTFGTRVDPFTKRAAFHSGVDFGTAAGTPVYATLPGTVVRAGLKGPYGLVIEIDHGNGFRTRYGHLGKSRVKRGQFIDFQEHIADAGNSGRSTGPHLHYEIWHDGKVKDPASFLNAGKQIFNIAEAIKPPGSR